MADEETEQMIPSDETITVSVGPEIMDFEMPITQHTEEQESLEDQMEEVVVKTEVIEDSGKPVLPPIPFSFPGQTFDTKCQKLILNVWDFFKRVKKNPDILDEIRTPQERAAAALHISAATIGKIGKNLKRTGKLETPGTKRKRSRPIVDSVVGSDEETIRQIISEMRSHKVTPTLPMVLTEARQRINFTGGATSFRRILQRMGYKNLSQKNVVKTKITVDNQSTSNSPSITTLKMIKKEPIDSVTTVMPAGSTTIGSAPGSSGTLSSSNIIHGGNVIQIGTSSSGTPLHITEEGAATILNATHVNGMGGTQTFYVQHADNTIRPIQIVYATSSLQQ